MNKIFKFKKLYLIKKLINKNKFLQLTKLKKVHKN